LFAYTDGYAVTAMVMVIPYYNNGYYYAPSGYYGSGGYYGNDGYYYRNNINYYYDNGSSLLLQLIITPEEKYM
jgi:hypothetical protein